MFLPIIKVQYYLQCCMPSPMPPYSYSPIMRPILSAPPPAKSVPISPAHLAGSPHYSPSSNKVSKKSYEKMLQVAREDVDGRGRKKKKKICSGEKEERKERREKPTVALGGRLVVALAACGGDDSGKTGDEGGGG